MESISFEEFQKVDIRVGYVISCSKIDKSKKMLILEVDFGDLGKKTVLTGLGEFFSPDYLVDEKVLFVFNVEPRKMLGYESQAVIMGTDEDEPKIIFAPKDSVPGVRVY